MVVCKLLSSSDYIFADSQLIRSVGITAACLLSRIHYWLQKSKVGIIHDNVKFVYNTAAQWSEQLGVSSRQVERAIAKLRKLGLLRIEKLAKHKSIRTNHYAINYEALDALLSAQKRAKMSEPSRQNVGINITKNTDKAKDINNNLNYNKSKTHEQNTIKNSNTEDKTDPKKQTQQVLQVDKINIYQKNINTQDQSDARQNKTVQDMVKIWESFFPDSVFKLNKEVARFLYSAFKTKFDSTMDLWKHYCQTIETSPYLMGEKFNLTLPWAIKFKTIDRIKAGELGVKITPIPGELRHLEKTVLEEINSSPESAQCKKMRLRLLKLYGIHAYNAWIRNAILFEEGAYIYYRAENSYGQDYIYNNFGRLIKSRPEEVELHYKFKLLEDIHKMKEPKKCIDTRKKLLELMGPQKYHQYIHGLKFFLLGELIRYTSNCVVRLQQARKILNDHGLAEGTIDA